MTCTQPFRGVPYQQTIADQPCMELGCHARSGFIHCQCTKLHLQRDRECCSEVRTTTTDETQFSHDHACPTKTRSLCQQVRREVYECIDRELLLTPLFHRSLVLPHEEFGLMNWMMNLLTCSHDGSHLFIATSGGRILVLELSRRGWPKSIERMLMRELRKNDEEIEKKLNENEDDSNLVREFFGEDSSSDMKVDSEEEKTNATGPPPPPPTVDANRIENPSLSSIPARSFRYLTLPPLPPEEMQQGEEDVPQPQPIDQITTLRMIHHGAYPVLAVTTMAGRLLLYDVNHLEQPPIIRTCKRANWEDNSAWSIAATPANFPTPLVVTGTNAHYAFLWKLHGTDDHPTSDAPSSAGAPPSTPFLEAGHNIPSIDISSCGRYLAMACIDGLVRVMELDHTNQPPNDSGLLRLSKSIPNNDEWGWTVRWIPSDSIRQWNIPLSALEQHEKHVSLLTPEQHLLEPHPPAEFNLNGRFMAGVLAGLQNARAIPLERLEAMRRELGRHIAQLQRDGQHGPFVFDVEADERYAEMPAALNHRLMEDEDEDDLVDDEDGEPGEMEEEEGDHQDYGDEDEDDAEGEEEDDGEEAMMDAADEWVNENGEELSPRASRTFAALARHQPEPAAPMEEVVEEMKDEEVRTEAGDQPPANEAAVVDHPASLPRNDTMNDTESSGPPLASSSTAEIASLNIPNTSSSASVAAEEIAAAASSARVAPPHRIPKPIEPRAETSDLLIYSSKSHLYLLDTSLQVLCSVKHVCRPTMTQHQHMDRLIFVEYLPELSTILVCSNASDRVLVYRLNQYSCGRYRFEVENVFPLKGCGLPIKGITVVKIPRDTRSTAASVASFQQSIERPHAPAREQDGIERPSPAFDPTAPKNTTTITSTDSWRLHVEPHAAPYATTQPTTPLITRTMESRPSPTSFESVLHRQLVHYRVYILYADKTLAGFDLTHPTCRQK